MGTNRYPVKETAMKKQLAKDIMNPDILAVGMDWSIDQLADYLIENSISGAPVISHDGKLHGVVSLTDIVRYKSIPVTSADHVDPHDYYIHTNERANLKKFFAHALYLKRMDRNSFLIRLS